MKYTTISISEELKYEVLTLKLQNKKQTLEELIKEMCEVYRKAGAENV